LKLFKNAIAHARKMVRDPEKTVTQRSFYRYGRSHTYSFEDRRKCLRQKALKIDWSNKLLSRNFGFFGF
jgi:hypothetical protein